MGEKERREKSDFDSKTLDHDSQIQKLVLTTDRSRSSRLLLRRLLRLLFLFPIRGSSSSHSMRRRGSRIGRGRNRIRARSCVGGWERGSGWFLEESSSGGVGKPFGFIGDVLGPTRGSNGSYSGRAWLIIGATRFGSGRTRIGQITFLVLKKLLYLC